MTPKESCGVLDILGENFSLYISFKCIVLLKTHNSEIVSGLESPNQIAFDGKWLFNNFNAILTVPLHKEA